MKKTGLRFSIRGMFGALFLLLLVGFAPTNAIANHVGHEQGTLSPADLASTVKVYDFGSGVLFFQLSEIPHARGYAKSYEAFGHALAAYKKVNPSAIVSAISPVGQFNGHDADSYIRPTQPMWGYWVNVEFAQVR